MSLMSVSVKIKKYFIAVGERTRIFIAKCLIGLAQKISYEQTRSSCFTVFTGVGARDYVPADGKWHHFSITIAGWLSLDPITMVKNIAYTETAKLNGKNVGTYPKQSGSMEGLAEAQEKFAIEETKRAEAESHRLAKLQAKLDRIKKGKKLKTKAAVRKTARRK